MSNHSFGMNSAKPGAFCWFSLGQNFEYIMARASHAGKQAARFMKMIAACCRTLVRDDPLQRFNVKMTRRERIDIEPLYDRHIIYIYICIYLNYI